MNVVRSAELGSGFRIEARLQDRPQSGIVAQRLIRLGGIDHDAAGAMKNRAGDEIGAGPALFEAHLGQARQPDDAQDDDDGADDRRNAEDLLRFNAETHKNGAGVRGCGVRGAVRSARCGVRGARRRAMCGVRYVRLQHFARCTTHLAQHFARCTTHLAPHFAPSTSHFAL